MSDFNSTIEVLESLTPAQLSAVQKRFTGVDSADGPSNVQSPPTPVDGSDDEGGSAPATPLAE